MQSGAPFSRLEFENVAWAYGGEDPALLRLRWARADIPCVAIAFLDNSIFLAFAVAAVPREGGRSAAQRAIVCETPLLIPLVDDDGAELGVDLPMRVVEFSDAVLSLLSLVPRGAAPFSEDGVYGWPRAVELGHAVSELLQGQGREDEISDLRSGGGHDLGPTFVDLSPISSGPSAAAAVRRRPAAAERDEPPPGQPSPVVRGAAAAPPQPSPRSP